MEYFYFHHVATATFIVKCIYSVTSDISLIFVYTGHILQHWHRFSAEYELYDYDFCAGNYFS